MHTFLRTIQYERRSRLRFFVRMPALDTTLTSAIIFPVAAFRAPSIRGTGTAPGKLCFNIHHKDSYQMSEISREQLLMAVIAGKGPAYLRGVDLSMLDLSNAGWLIEADLRHSNLSHAILARSNLRNAKLQGANLQDTRFAGADLEGADLSGAKMVSANLRYANLREVNLSGANLVGANLFRTVLEGANLEGVDLEGANLEGADLTGAKLVNANLKMANLHGANLKSVSLSGTVMPKPVNGDATPQPQGGFVGSINSIQLYDLLQLVCLSRNTLSVKVESEYGKGIIEVRSGRVSHAQTDLTSGEPALLEILDWGNGRFETEPLCDDVTCTINKPLEHFILESVRKRDEKHLSNDQLSSDLLINEIRTHTPLRAYPTKGLLRFLSEKGESLNPAKEIQVNDVFDSGESAGLMCSISADEAEFIAPLKFIKLRRDHPLFRRVFEYIRQFAGASRESGSNSIFGLHA